MEREKLNPGDTVFISGDLRDKHRNKLTKATIKKIGRKWIEVEPSYLGRFSIETGMEDAGAYTPVRKLYLSADEFYNKMDIRSLCRAIRNVFNQTDTKIMETVSVAELEEVAHLLHIDFEKVEREF